jgi:uncharacterized protein
MKTYLNLIFFLFLFTEGVYTQNLYFPKSYYLDSLALQQYMPLLAQSLIKVYKDIDKNNYYNQLTRYQVLAKDYDGARQSIKSYRKLEFHDDTIYAKGTFAQFEAYSLSMQRCNQTNERFDTVYLQTLKSIIKDLNDKTVYEVSFYYGLNLAEMKKTLDIQIRSLDTTKDSISIEQARKLCRSYISYIVYAQILPVGKPYVQTLSANQLIVEDSVLIKTRDGAILSARIARKKNQIGKLPCILQFNIYAKRSDRNTAIDAALNGYVGVVVNPRGKYLSNDSFVPYEDDSKDVYDAIEWISKQPWCNGKVGMYGGSHLGFSQWAAAKSMHPALKTIVPQVPLVPGVESVYRGSIAATSNLSTIYFHTSSKFAPNIEFRQSQHWDSLYKNWYLKGLPFNTLDSLDGRPNAIFQKWITHPSYDTYWQSMIPYRKEYSKINIPVLTITGHFDGNIRGSFYYFHEHYKYNKNANHYIIFGPYDHFGAQGTPIDNEDYKMDQVARINIEQLVFDWFDYVLKGKPKPLFIKDKINYQVMGKNIWKHKPNMKAISNDTIKFYLGNDSTNGQFPLYHSKPNSLKYFTQTIDFKDRSDTNYQGNASYVLNKALGKHCAQIFITEPLNEDIEVSGEFLLQLSTMINKKDMDLEITLLEKLADGTGYFSLSEACSRVSYLKDISKRNLIKPNVKVCLPKMKGRFMSKKISKGSQLVVLIGVIKENAREINYGTGKDVSTESIKDAGEPLQIKWYNDSYIKIPVWRDSLTGSGSRNQK